VACNVALSRTKCSSNISGLIKERIDRSMEKLCSSHYRIVVLHLSSELRPYIFYFIIKLKLAYEGLAKAKVQA